MDLFSVAEKPRKRKPKFSNSSVNIRKEKKRTITEIRTWEDLFTDKVFALAFISMADLIDVIDVARTSRRLYRFYFGAGELTPELCKLVKAKYGFEYKTPPLKYLGMAFNTEKMFDKISGKVLYKANLCVRCYCKPRKSNYLLEKRNYIYCSSCNSSVVSPHSTLQQHLLPLILDAVRSKYHPSQLPRIMRMVIRYEPEIDKSMSELHRKINHEAILDRHNNPNYDYNYSSKWYMLKYNASYLAHCDVFMQWISVLDLTLLPPPMAMPLL